MTKRAVAVCVVMASSLILAACIPAAPPPSYPNPPAVIAISTTPAVLVAGQPVTFTIEVTHPVGVLAVTTRLTRDSVQLPAVYGCGDDHQVLSGTPTDRIVSIDCTWPEQAPPGPWTLTATATAADSATATKKFTFHFDGPSKDTYGPKFLDGGPTPKNVHAEDTITFTAHVRDDHGPITYDLDYLANGIAPLDNCVTNNVDDGSVAPVYFISITCEVHYPYQPPGPDVYEPVSFFMYDAFGYSSYLSQPWYFSVIE